MHGEENCELQRMAVHSARTHKYNIHVLTAPLLLLFKRVFLSMSLCIVDWSRVILLESSNIPSKKKKNNKNKIILEQSKNNNNNNNNNDDNNATNNDDDDNNGNNNDEDDNDDNNDGTNDNKDNKDDNNNKNDSNDDNNDNNDNNDDINDNNDDYKNDDDDNDDNDDNNDNNDDNNDSNDNNNSNFKGSLMLPCGVFVSTLNYFTVVCLVCYFVSVQDLSTLYVIKFRCGKTPRYLSQSTQLLPTLNFYQLFTYDDWSIETVVKFRFIRSLFI